MDLLTPRRSSNSALPLHIALVVSDRTQQVAYGGQLSTTRPLLFAVPQGSVLRPWLYILYTAKLEHVVTQHGMRLHKYADDSQLYLHVTVSDTVVAVQCFAACVSKVNDWMRASRLRLNPAKTELMWLCSYQQLKQVDIDDTAILSMQVSR